MIGQFYIPARYVFLLVRVTDVFLSSFMDGCMPLAITSMVRSTTTTDANTTTVVSNSSASADVCPGAPEMTNSSSKSKGGDFDWNELMQSYVTNGFTYGALVSMIVAGRLIQMWSPKMMSIASSIVAIVITLLTPVLAYWNVYALIVARVLQGLLYMGINMPTMFALDSTWFPPEERQQLCSIIFGFVSVASIISSSVTGHLLDSYGWECVFYIFGVLKILSLCIWIFTIYDSPLKHPRISEEEKIYITSTVKKDTETNLPVPWVQMFLSAPLWAYLAISIANSWVMFILNTELPTYLTKMLYYSTTNAGLLVSASNAVGCVIQLICGFLSQWLRRKGYISHLTSYRIFNGVVTLGTAAALIGITQSGCNTAAIVTLLLLIKGFQSALIAGSFLNHLDLAINFVPILSGLNGTITSVAGIISPTLVAAIINDNQTLTAWNEVFYISAAVSAAPYIIFLIFGSVEEQSWNKIANDNAVQETKDHEEQSSSTEKSSNYNVSIKCD